MLTSYQAIENKQSFYNVVKTTGFKKTPFWSSISDLAFDGDPNKGQSWFYRKRKDGGRTHTHLEGGAAADLNTHTANKLQNELMIFKDSYGVSGSQDAATTVDSTKSIQVQRELTLDQIQLDIEAYFLGSQAPVANADDATARVMGGVKHYMVNENDAAAAALTWDIFEDMLQTCWSNGVEVTNILLGSFQKRALNNILNAMAGRQTSSTAVVSGGQNFVTIKESAFAPEINILLSPFVDADEIIFYDPKIVHSVLHRSYKDRDISDSDDAIKKEMLFELSLQIDDPYAVTRIHNLAIV